MYFVHHIYHIYNRILYTKIFYFLFSRLDLPEPSVCDVGDDGVFLHHASADVVLRSLFWLLVLDVSLSAIVYLGK